MSGAICDGGDVFWWRQVAECPNEHKRRRIIGRFQHWYGWEWHCLGCGDSWTLEEFGSRPFARAWRKAAIARHKAMWDSAPAGDRRAAFRAFINDYFGEGGLA